MKKTAAVTRQLIISERSGYQLVDINSIIRVEAISNYSKLYFTDGKTLVTAKVLRWFEEQLASDPFIRTHRTHLVNRNFISSYIPGKGSRIKLLNGEWIDVSKRKKMYFLKKLKTMAA